MKSRPKFNQWHEQNLSVLEFLIVSRDESLMQKANKQLPLALWDKTDKQGQATLSSLVNIPQII